MRLVSSGLDSKNVSNHTNDPVVQFLAGTASETLSLMIGFATALDVLTDSLSPCVSTLR